MSVNEFVGGCGLGNWKAVEVRRTVAEAELPIYRVADNLTYPMQTIATFEGPDAAINCHGFVKHRYADTGETQLSALLDKICLYDRW